VEARNVIQTLIASALVRVRPEDVKVVVRSLLLGVLGMLGVLALL
jgi:hypothetical protein